MPFSRPLQRARHRGRLRFRRLRVAARQGAGADRLGGAAGASCAAAARPANWSAPGSRFLSRRAGSARSTAPGSAVDTTGAVELVTGGSSVGQGFATAMAQICAETLGVDYRRVRVVLRPDRPHPVRHRRARLARFGDDRQRDPCGGAEAARQGAGHGGRAVAGRAGRARHRRRRGGAPRPARRRHRSRSARSRGIWRRTRRRSATATPGLRRKAGSAPST